MSRTAARFTQADVASALGIFPSITLGSRLWDRFGEAWFICGAYFMCRVLEAAQARNAAGSPKKP